MKEQIEKMAQEICAFCVETCGDCNLIAGKPCESVMVEAEHLYNAGYRKQEWISVDDRLPTWEDGKVLIYTTHGISIAQRTTSERWQGGLAKPKWITHWMPLPEPPKMKGGAE